VNDLNSINDMMNFSQESLFRLSDTMTKIPQALVFEGIKSFGESFVDCISEIIDNFKRNYTKRKIGGFHRLFPGYKFIRFIIVQFKIVLYSFHNSL
jgi:hypothetical protein